MPGILCSELVKRVGLGVLAVAVAMAAIEAPILAGEPGAGVPEISGASLSTGLGLVGAGVLWMRARR